MSKPASINRKQLTANYLLLANAANAPLLRYASGFSLVDPVVFLKQGRKRFLVVPALEYGRAKAGCPGVKVVTPAELPLTPQQQRSLNGWLLGVVKLAGLKRVTVDEQFPVGAAQYLKRNGIAISITCENPYPQREVKTTTEIQCIKLAQKAAVTATRKAIGIIKAATVNKKKQLVYDSHVLTAEAVRLSIQKTLLEQDCIDAMDTIVACGVDAADPHERGSGPLLANQTIVIDIFPQHRTNGYWGDITRTVLKGKATPTQKRMYRAVKKAQLLALSMLKPGVEGIAVHKAVAACLEEEGFATTVSPAGTEGFFHGTGHGVGLEIHEGPSLSLRPGKLKAGNVVTVEPGLYYKEHGGVRIEDTVVITRGGFDFLARCEKVFEVA